MNRYPFAALVFSTLSLPVRAQEAIVAYKSLDPDVALDLARTVPADCRQRGYQVAVGSWTGSA
jgi:hypothetical protein